MRRHSISAQGTQYLPLCRPSSILVSFHHEMARLVGKVVQFQQRGDLLTSCATATTPDWAKQLTRLPCLVAELVIELINE